MTDTLKTLFDILRLKSGPADLPTSPRLMWGLLGLLVSLQALLGAWLMPEDKAILPQAIAHRLQPIPGAGRGAIEQVQAMVEATAIP